MHMDSTKPKPDRPVYYSTDELADMLQTTATVIHAAVRKGHLRAIKVGNGYRFSQGSVDAFIAQRTKDVAP
jgi:excisionase family DNA binding protein